MNWKPYYLLWKLRNSKKLPIHANLAMYEISARFHDPNVRGFISYLEKMLWR